MATKITYRKTTRHYFSEEKHTEHLPSFEEKIHTCTHIHTPHTSFLVLQQNKYTHTQCLHSTSGQKGVIGTMLTQKPKTTKKPDKIYEKAVFKHWTTGSTGKRSLKEGNQIR